MKINQILNIGLLGLGLMFTFIDTSAQLSGIGLKIGNGSGNKSTSALLDLESTTSGLLIPRMTTTQRNAINGVSSSNGLMAYSTDNNSLDVYSTSATTWNRFGANTSIFNVGGISTIGINTYGTTLGSTLNLFNARGTVASPANLATNDEIGRIVFGGQANGAMRNLASITSNYTGTGTSQAASMSFRIVNSTPMFIAANGNVGIGTTTPLSQLTVSRLTAAIRVEDLNANSATGADATSRISFTAADSISLASIGHLEYFDTGNFYIRNDIPNRMVNISINSPVSTTEASDKSILRLLRRGTYVQNTIGEILSVSKYPSVVDFSVGSYTNRDSSTTFLNMKLGNGETFTPEVDVMTLMSDKKVGIGTTAPSSNLHVDGTFAVNTGATTNSTVILVGTGTLNLPNASTVSGRMYFIRNTSTTTNVSIPSVIDFNSASATTFSLTPVIGAIMVVSNGTNWYRIR